MTLLQKKGEPQTEMVARLPMIYGYGVSATHRLHCSYVKATSLRLAWGHVQFMLSFPTEKADGSMLCGLYSYEYEKISPHYFEEGREIISAGNVGDMLGRHVKCHRMPSNHQWHHQCHRHSFTVTCDTFDVTSYIILLPFYLMLYYHILHHSMMS